MDDWPRGRYVELHDEKDIQERQRCPSRRGMAMEDRRVGHRSSSCGCLSLPHAYSYILEDAHHERRFTPELSTFPTKEGNYGYVQVIQRSSPENVLPKLHIASRACDLLVVSSHRLDHESVNLGAHTTHFEPSSRTRIFLDKRSVQRAHDLFKKDSIEEASTMSCLYQLKQVRSKFDKLSTYTRCRVSSDFTSPLELQPCTIWTLVDQDTTNSNLSQERLASNVFQKIAINVIRNGENAVIKSSDLTTGVSAKKGCAIETLINKIKTLSDTITIIGNSELNSILVDLAGTLMSGIKKKNDKKIEQISKIAYL
ncbi:hypothetical protein RMATCC62417_14565 [Rhizopus microsporus]|nr:hypothetical protein RMATCC62417_14565 [Rhizopus microsporus]